jgi:hypothetical protein
VSGAAPLQLRIERITVGAASGLDARRLADALPAALERALAGVASGREPAALRAGVASPAEQAAAQVEAAVRAHLGAGR